MTKTADDTERTAELQRLLDSENGVLLGAISKAELDQQITTARAFPRSLAKFREECLQMSTLNVEVAESCLYALPRGKNPDGTTKYIEGPSVRLAEIIASAWGNCRVATRIVAEEHGYITAQGVFQDVQRNYAVSRDVRRRITNNKGERYNADMIGVTANAASSIAMRNAILAGVPKAFWADIEMAARRTALGTNETFAKRRDAAMSRVQEQGVAPEKVFATLGVKGIADVTLEHLRTLQGILTAIRDGDTTVADAFAPKEIDDAEEPKKPGKGLSGLKQKLQPEQSGGEPVITQPTFPGPDFVGNTLAAIHAARTKADFAIVLERFKLTHPQYKPDEIERIESAMRAWEEG